MPLAIEEALVVGCDFVLMLLDTLGWGIKPGSLIELKEVLGAEGAGEYPQDRESPPRQRHDPRWSGLNLFRWMAAVKHGKRRTAAS